MPHEPLDLRSGEGCQPGGEKVPGIVHSLINLQFDSQHTSLDQIFPAYGGEERITPPARKSKADLKMLPRFMNSGCSLLEQRHGQMSLRQEIIARNTVEKVDGFLKLLVACLMVRKVAQSKILRDF